MDHCISIFPQREEKASTTKRDGMSLIRVSYTPRRHRVTLSVGRTVRVPCEVKSGPFSNERLVRVQGGEPESWVGFVPIWYLQEPVEQGETKCAFRSS
jgi:hypothetical protein